MHLVKLGAAILITLVCRCGTTQMSSRQLERVAKDWCLTIRASQVLPVYPLSEDIQPGDVYLVQTSIDDQISVYKKRGFLPLDNHLIRLEVPAASYGKFYSNRYDLDGKNLPPEPWQFGSSNYGRAPLAAFPSYSFSVSRSEGLNLAVPIHAIPVGLNLLDSAAASGTVGIKDAVTYGLDIGSIQALANDWASKHKTYLTQFAPKQDSPGKPSQLFLRVVYRVYLAKRMEVTLRSDEASAGSLSAGLPRPVSLLSLGSKDTDAVKNFESVNKVLAEAFNPTTQPTAKASATTSPSASTDETPAIGGTVKVAMAAARSVSLVETFNRPLCIGYLTIDLPILAGGALGGPISTVKQLEAPGKQATPTPIAWGPDENSATIKAYIKAEPGNREKVVKWLDANKIGVALTDVILGGAHADTRTRLVNELIQNP